jgi:nucleoid DNA-binding protein
MTTATTKRPTTTRKTTATKSTAAKTTRAKPASSTTARPATAISAVPDLVPDTQPHVVTASKPVVAEPDLKKKELIDQVVERSGIKKKDAKPVVEAMLAVLGETIADGRELNLAPLGKLRINRVKEANNGRVIICKLRQPKPVAKDPAAVPLAEDND